MIVKLERDFASPVCRQGILYVGDLQLQTLERPWVATVSPGGAKGISCVPPGLYHLEKHSTEAHPKTWALVNASLGVLHWPNKNMPDARTAVLIHVANHPSELRGCIAVGLVKGDCAIMRSKDAFTLLLTTLPWTDEHSLEIRSL